MTNQVISPLDRFEGFIFACQSQTLTKVRKGRAISLFWAPFSRDHDPYISGDHQVTQWVDRDDRAITNDITNVKAWGQVTSFLQASRQPSTAVTVSVVDTSVHHHPSPSSESG